MKCLLTHPVVIGAKAKETAVAETLGVLSLGLPRSACDRPCRLPLAGVCTRPTVSQHGTAVSLHRKPEWLCPSESFVSSIDVTTS